MIVITRSRLQGVASALVIVLLTAYSASAFVNRGSGSTGLTERTGGSGSGGTAGVGSTTLAPDLFTGVLQHSVPLEVVPGRHGLQPTISLSYRSTNGNGPLGVGWTVDSSSIQRRTKGGLNYAADDYVLINAGGAADLVNLGPGQYEVIFESGFQRIRRLVSGADVYWEVTERTGMKFYYGETAESRQFDPSNTNNIFKWCLDRVVDTHGNYIEYHYLKDANEIYPSTINYTGHTAPDLPPTNSVSFTWGSRYDAPQDFSLAFSAPVQTQWRLERVDVSAGSALVRRYRLDYVTSAGSNRSLLSAVTQVGKDGVSSLPSMTFNWSAPNGTGFGTGTLSGKYAFWASARDRIRPADVDGDGYEDLVFPDSNGNWYVFFGSPYGLIERESQPCGIFDWSSNGVSSGTIFVGDVDGDGKQDLIVGPSSSNGAIATMFSTGTSFTAPQGWTTLQAYAVWSDHPARIRVFDVDGDGRTDVLFGPDAGGAFRLLRSNGFSFDDEGTWIGTMPGWDSDGAQARVNFVDVTGDGLADLVLGPDTSGNWRVFTNLGAGHFTNGVLWATGKYAAWSSDIVLISPPAGSLFPSRLVRFMDVNGDGKMDVVIGPERDGATAGNWYVMLSTGSGFSDQGAWMNIAGGDYTNWSGYPGRIRAVDVNGDGKTDLLIGPDELGQWFVIRSIGYQFLNDGAVLNAFAPTAFPPLTEPDNQDRFRAFDVNGDGRLDIVVGPDDTGAWSEAFGAALPSGTFPDLLAGIHNGYGGSSSLQYASSTQFANTNLPFAIQVVSSVTTSDGNGNVAVTNYSYAGGYFRSLAVPADREFRGFASATVTGPAWPDGSRAVTTTYFHQGNGTTAMPDDPSVPIANMKGKPYRVVSADSITTYYFETDTAYQASNGPLYFNPPTRVDKFYCTSAANCGRQKEREAKVTFEYDAYGNITRQDDYGSLDDPSDDRTLVRLFSPNVADWVVGLPYSEVWYSGAGGALTDRVAETDYYFDGSSDCSAASTNTAPTKGDITRVVRWLNGGTSPDTRTAYDAYGNVSCTRDPNGNISQMYYDNALHTFLLSVTSPPTDQMPQGPTTSTAYYGVNGVPWTPSGSDGVYGLVQSTTDANQVATSSTYDVFGRAFQSIGPDGFTTTWAYNSFGTVTTQNVRVASPAGISETYFDGFGRTTKTRQQGSASGRWIDTVTTYLATGAVEKATAPYFEVGGAQHWTNFAYDVRGRVLTTTFPDATILSSCYDDLTGATAVVDPNLHRKRSVKDVHGRVVRVDEYMGTVTACSAGVGVPYATTTYSYDLFGRPEQVTNAVGAPIVTSYDTLGRRILASDPDLGNWTYAYDAAGNVVYQQDAIGRGILFRYDALNRPILKHYCATGSKEVCATEPQAPGDVAYSYDSGANAKGRLSQMVDGSGSTSYAYDIMGRVISTTQMIDTSATFITAQEYDPATRRLRNITYPDYPANSQVIYEYDADGNLYRVRDQTRTYATLTEYDQYGRPGHVDFGNSRTGTYSFDPMTARLSALTLSNGSGGYLLDLSYQYDNVGNILRVTESQDPTKTQQFNYDELNRLRSAQSQAYDPDNAFTPFGLTYTYDPVRVHVLNSTWDGAATASYVHDSNGNRTSDGYRTFTWDVDNRPTCIAIPGSSCSPISGTPVILTYDGNGARVKKVRGASVVLYSGKLYECAASTCTRYIYAGRTRIAAVTAGLPAHYLHTDHLGSTRVLTDDSGQVADSIFYQPFGRVASETGPASSRYTFTGQGWDAETALYDYGDRLYDAAIARFVSPDSVIPNAYSAPLLNRYAYAANNPLAFVDPSGHFPIAPILMGAVVGAIVGGIAAASTGHNVLQGMAVGALSGAALGTGNALVLAYSVKTGIGTATIYGAMGAAAGGFNAQLQGGNVVAGALVGGALAVLGDTMPTYLKVLDDGWPEAVQVSANRIITGAVSGAALGAAESGMTGHDIGEGALLGAKWSAVGAGVNLSIGATIGYWSSGGNGPTSIDRRNGIVYFENARPGSKAYWGVSVGGVITAGRGVLDQSAAREPQMTVRDHEVSHSRLQLQALSWAYVPVHIVSQFIGGLLGDDHYYNLFERGWIDVPDW